MGYAKSGNGMSTRGGVRSTMTPAFRKATVAGQSGGDMGHNKAPFDRPQSMGNGSIPTKFFDTSIKATPAKTVSAGGAMAKAQGSAPSNVGNRRFSK